MQSKTENALTPWVHKYLVMICLQASLNSGIIEMEYILGNNVPIGYIGAVSIAENKAWANAWSFVLPTMRLSTVAL